MTIVRRAFVLFVLVTSCAEEEVHFAGPSAIKGKQIPGVPGQETPGATGSELFPAPYDAKSPLPSRSAKEAHAGAGQIAPTPDLACMTCHKSGPGAPAAFAGYVAAADGTPGKAVDVVVIDGSGKRLAVKSDDDGFFWLAGTEPGAGSRVAVRDATGKTAEMNPTFTGGACTSSKCHGPAESAGVVTVR